MVHLVRRGFGTRHLMSFEVVEKLWKDHSAAPPRIRAIDLFMAFLLCSGIVQFVFCIVVGNYPFNAFLAGFGANVAQFVLLANLRQQINPVNNKEFTQVSPKRAFGDFVVASLILHFLSWHFIN